MDECSLSFSSSSTSPEDSTVIDIQFGKDTCGLGWKNIRQFWEQVW
jgi:hypothetical protein